MKFRRAALRPIKMNFPPLTRIPALRALGAVCLLFAARPAIYAQLPGEAVPVITWPTPGAIVHGTALSSLQLDASANVPGSFSYSPAAGTVLPLGNNVLRVIFSPHDSADYVGTTASVTLQVDPPLAITWSSPAMIAYGTPLSALQLDASANAAGSFSYNPSAGTVLAEGGHTLTATFTPADTAIFATTTASVVLYVTALPLFYVSNGSGDTILEITSDGTSSTFISGFDEPNGLAADASGNLYVASGDGNLITKIPPSGSVAAGSTFATGMSDPVGLAFDQSGNLYVANFGNDTISKSRGQRECLHVCFRAQRASRPGLRPQRQSLREQLRR